MSDPVSRDAIRRFWSAHPHDYHQGGGASDWASFRNIDRKVWKLHTPWAHAGFPLLHHLVPYPELQGKRVLDLGCGTGWALEQLDREGARVSGVDLARTHVEWTRRRLALAGREAQVAEGDGAALPFRSQSFDYVLAWGVIMHAPQPEALVAEIHRVLRPGGRVGAMLYHAGSLHWRWSIGFLHGILGLERLRFPMAEVHRRHTNNPEIGGSPVARAYRRAEARALFAGFPRVDLEVCDTARAMGFFPSKRLPLALLLPRPIRRAMARRLGFHLWVEARRG